MEWHNHKDDLSVLTKGWLACAFKNTSSPVGILQDQGSFLLPFKSNAKDDRGALRYSPAPNLLRDFIDALIPLNNYKAVFTEAGKIKDPDLSVKLGEFSQIVLQNERALGFVPEKSHFEITSVNEPVGSKIFDAWHKKPRFHCDVYGRANARVYFVSDEISPTLIKTEGALLTCKPYEVYCMSGHTHHGRGPQINARPDDKPAGRNFARIIVF